MRNSLGMGTRRQLSLTAMSLNIYNHDPEEPLFSCAWVSQKQ